MGNKTWQYVALLLSLILAITGTITYSNLISSLVELKGITYNYTGDLVSNEMIFKPEIWLNTSYWEVCFAHYNDTKYADSGVLFKKRSRSRTLHVNLDYVDSLVTTHRLSTNGTWEKYKIQTQWNVPTYGKKWRPLKDGDCWKRGRTNKIQLVFNVPDDNIYKWSFNLTESNIGVYIDPLLTQYSKEDIVEKSDIIELNDLTKCIYKTYKNPTNKTYCFVDGVSNKISGMSLNTKTEIEIYVIKSYIENVCNVFEVYSINNNTLYNTTLCNGFNRTFKEYSWIETDKLCIDAEHSLEFRRCYTKKAKLDNYIYEDHQPAFGYDLKEFTLINSTGVNDTKLDVLAETDFETGTVEGWVTQLGSIGVNSGSKITGTYSLLVNDDGPGDVFYYRFENKTSGSILNITYNILFDATDQFLVYGQAGNGDAYNTAANTTTKCMLFQTTTFNCLSVPSTWVSTSITPSTATVYKISQVLDPVLDTYSISIDGILKLVGIASNDVPTNRFYVASANAGSDIMYVDDFIIREMNATLIRGPYNATGTFNVVTFQSDCTDNDMNISRTSSGFTGLSDSGEHTFASQDFGFFIRVDTEQCNWIDYAISNSTIDNVPVVNLITPVNDALFTNYQNISFLGNASDIENLINVSIFINGTLNQTDSSGLNNTDYSFSIYFGASARSYSWLYMACDNSSTGTCKNTSSRIFNTTDNVPVVTLTSPAADSRFVNYQSITFTGSASDDINLINVSIYINDTLNLTNTSGINDTNYIFAIYFGDAAQSHNWLYESCDNNSQCTNTSSRIFNTTDDAPNITAISPANNEVLNASPVSFVVEVFEDIKVNNVSIYLNNTINTSSYSGLNGVNYTLNIAIGIGNLSFSWIGEACDNITQCTNTSSRIFNTTISVLDTCSCPSLDENWQIDMGDFCNITSDCDIGNGVWNFTGIGTTRCNATINMGTFQEPGNSSRTLEIDSNCYINVTV